AIAKHQKSHLPRKTIGPSGNRSHVEVADGLRDRLETLSLATLEDLGEALLDFSEAAAVSQWLDAR
ncbi:MAG: DUF4351 domain-containing protein, partial [Cyanobacteria bacterium J06641_5]